MLVGTVNDPDLGSVIAVGLGGLQARLTESAAFRLPPATDAEADELIDAAKGVAAELNGLRGSAPLDREALRELILRFTLLLAEVPALVEADLNPVRCMTQRLPRARHATADRTPPPHQPGQDLVTGGRGPRRTNRRLSCDIVWRVFS